MSRGPTRTPTEILKLRGSDRGKARDKVEPKPPVGAPEPPAEMPDEVRPTYDELVALLEEVPGLLTHVDGQALARFALLESHFWESVEFVKKYGKTYSIKDRDEKVVNFGTHRQWSDVKDLAALLDKLGAKFGMTPADRARIQLESQGDGADAVASRQRA